MRITLWLLCGIMLCSHHLQGEEPKKPVKPGAIQFSELREAPTLAGKRRQMLDTALALAAREQWFRYTYSGESPNQGGFDCSGAVFYLLQSAGIDPPRSSQAQYDWIKKSGAMVEIPADTSSLKNVVFAKLKPGDLLFWSGTLKSDTGTNITHVQIYLGHEKNGDLPVMIGASDGRTYRNVRRSGYGVYDFKLPTAKSKARLVGYGSPPGLK